MRRRVSLQALFVFVLDANFGRAQLRCHAALQACMSPCFELMMINHDMQLGVTGSAVGWRTDRSSNHEHTGLSMVPPTLCELAVQNICCWVHALPASPPHEHTRCTPYTHVCPFSCACYPRVCCPLVPIDKKEKRQKKKEKAQKKQEQQQQPPKKP